jgi:hypothetical protein
MKVERGRVCIRSPVSPISTITVSIAFAGLGRSGEVEEEHIKVTRTFTVDWRVTAQRHNPKRSWILEGEEGERRISVGS